MGTWGRRSRQRRRPVGGAGGAPQARGRVRGTTTHQEGTGYVVFDNQLCCLSQAMPDSATREAALFSHRRRPVAAAVGRAGFGCRPCGLAQVSPWMNSPSRQTRRSASFRSRTPCGKASWSCPIACLLVARRHRSTGSAAKDGSSNQLRSTRSAATPGPKLGRKEGATISYSLRATVTGLAQIAQGPGSKTTVSEFAECACGVQTLPKWWLALAVLGWV